MKIKTKNGFECNINERRLKDWRYVKAAAKINNGNNEADILEAVTFAVPFLLGDEEEKLMAFVEEDGAIDSEKLLAEFLQITQIAGEKVKKSQSSSSS